MIPRQDRIFRLKDLARPAEGYVGLAICQSCRHRDGFPFGLLVKRYGAECPVDMAVKVLRCSQCGTLGRVRYELALLCEPGCTRQRRSGSQSVTRNVTPNLKLRSISKQFIR